jgi:hypothetical protein
LHVCKTSNTGWCQDLKLSWAVSKSPWTMTVLASKCLGCWTWWNESSGHNFLHSPGTRALRR